MKETIYLVVSRRKVERMTKTLPNVYRGEVVAKLNVNVTDKAFDPPTLDQDVVIDDWRKGIDLEDVEFNQNVITKEEADMIRERRLARMQEILEGQGYEITKPDEDAGA